MMGSKCRLGAALVLTLAGPAHAGVTTYAEMVAAMPAGASFTIFPAATSIEVEDTLGIRPGVNAATAGTWAGVFECFSFAYPCQGAFRITYTFPFEILGFFGDLVYAPGYYYNATTNRGLDLLADVPVRIGGCGGSGTAYCGSWGQYFAAPTHVVTILWPPGLTSTDDIASFRLTNAVAVLVPEPGSLALFGAGLLGVAVTAGIAAARRGSAARRLRARSVAG